MTCSRRSFLGGCMAGLLVTALPAARAASNVSATATSVTAPSTASTTASDAHPRVRLQHAPTSFVHLPSPRTTAGAGTEHRRLRMHGAPLRRCTA
jgi:hypothetical protein